MVEKKDWADMDDRILQAPPPPDPSAFYASFQLDPDVLAHARALAAAGGDILGALEAHGFIVRTWLYPDPQAAVRALLAGGDVPSPARHLDGWLSDLGSIAIRAYVLRAHARLDAWAEDLDELDPNDPVPPSLADHLLVERDGLESLRAVLSRVGERDLGARLDANDPRLRDGPDVAFDPTIERPWLAKIRRDPAAWWSEQL